MLDLPKVVSRTWRDSVRFLLISSFTRRELLQRHKGLHAEPTSQVNYEESVERSASILQGANSVRFSPGPDALCICQDPPPGLNISSSHHHPSRTTRSPVNNFPPTSDTLLSLEVNETPSQAQVKVHSATPLSAGSVNDHGTYSWLEQIITGMQQPAMTFFGSEDVLSFPQGLFETANRVSDSAADNTLSHIVESGLNTRIAAAPIGVLEGLTQTWQNLSPGIGLNNLDNIGLERFWSSALHVITARYPIIHTATFDASAALHSLLTALIVIGAAFSKSNEEADYGVACQLLPVGRALAAMVG